MLKIKNKIMSHFQCLHVETGYGGRRRVPNVGIPPGANKSFDKGLLSKTLRGEIDLSI